jgi:hypothetical protein
MLRKLIKHGWRAVTEAHTAYWIVELLGAVVPPSILTSMVAGLGEHSVAILCTIFFFGLATSTVVVLVILGYRADRKTISPSASPTASLSDDMAESIPDVRVADNPSVIDLLWIKILQRYRVSQEWSLEYCPEPFQDGCFADPALFPEAGLVDPPIFKVGRGKPSPKTNFGNGHVEVQDSAPELPMLDGSMPRVAVWRVQPRNQGPMSLTGSCFSSESAPRPFHHGIRGRGGTIFRSALPSCVA